MQISQSLHPAFLSIISDTQPANTLLSTDVHMSVCISEGPQETKFPITHRVILQIKTSALEHSRLKGIRKAINCANY